jgi:hypothetical protein
LSAFTDNDHGDSRALSSIGQIDGDRVLALVSVVIQDVQMNRSWSGNPSAAVDQLRRIQPSPVLGTRGDNANIHQVRLWAWAEDVAADLHRRFPTLQIVVGYQLYPDGVPEHDVDLDSWYANIPVLDPQ